MRRGGRRKPPADGGQRERIDGVGLGQETQAVGELPRAGRMEHADGHAGRAQGRDDRALVDARGLADHMDGPAVGGDPGGQGAVAGGIIGGG